MHLSPWLSRMTTGEKLEGWERHWFKLTFFLPTSLDFILVMKNTVLTKQRSFALPLFYWSKLATTSLRTFLISEIKTLTEYCTKYKTNYVCATSNFF